MNQLSKHPLKKRLHCLNIYTPIFQPQSYFNLEQLFIIICSTMVTIKNITFMFTNNRSELN